jgi:hypothetical protein
MKDSIRTDALNWWRSMSFQRQEAMINLWKLITTSSKNEYSNLLIRWSDMMIERIYREYILRENFKN